MAKEDNAGRKETDADVAAELKALKVRVSDLETRLAMLADRVSALECRTLYGSGEPKP